MTTDAPDLTILMPVFNELKTVEHAIKATLEVPLPVESRELLIIDDGSTDGTRDLLRNGSWPDEVRIVYHERNMGKGAAIVTGLGDARGRYSAVMDADLEYDPGEIALLLPLFEQGADAVFGVRGFQSHNNFNFWYVLGNKFVTLAANAMFNSWVSDIMTCHKVMETELFRSLDLRERGFAVEAEITARLLQRGARIYEVPISYIARDREEGKKLTAMDGVRTLRTLVRCRLTPGQAPALPAARNTETPVPEELRR